MLHQGAAEQEEREGYDSRAATLGQLPYALEPEPYTPEEVWEAQRLGARLALRAWRRAAARAVAARLRAVQQLRASRWVQGLGLGLK